MIEEGELIVTKRTTGQFSIRSGRLFAELFGDIGDALVTIEDLDDYWVLRAAKEGLRDELFARPFMTLGRFTYGVNFIKDATPITPAFESTMTTYEVLDGDNKGDVRIFKANVVPEPEPEEPEPEEPVMLEPTNRYALNSPLADLLRFIADMVEDGTVPDNAARAVVDAIPAEILIDFLVVDLR